MVGTITDIRAERLAREARRRIETIVTRLLDEDLKPEQIGVGIGRETIDGVSYSFQLTVEAELSVDLKGGTGGIVSSG